MSSPYSGDYRLEAMRVDDALNEEICNLLRPLGYEDVPGLTFETNGTWGAILFEEFPVWDTESVGVPVGEDDEEIPLEDYVRQQVMERVSVIRRVDVGDSSVRSSPHAHAAEAVDTGALCIMDGVLCVLDGEGNPISPSAFDPETKEALDAILEAATEHFRRINKRS